MHSHLFFLRAYNDIDNITPVIHFCLERHTADQVLIIIYSGDYNYHNNENLKFLSQQHGERIKVRWIGEWLKLNQNWWFHPILTFRRIYKLWHWLTGHAPRQLMGKKFYSRLMPQRKRRKIFQNILEIAGQPKRVYFDLNRTHSIGEAAETMRELGVEGIDLLPVSPHINANVLREISFKKPDIDYIKYKTAYDYIDRIGLANDDLFQSTAEVYKALGSQYAVYDQCHLLGSIRYCPEWMAIRETMYKPYESSTKKTKLLFFLSRPEANTYWQEIINSLNFLAHFSNIEVIIKPHTRDHGLDIPAQASHITVDYKTPSTPLVNWADAVMVWSSSIALEAYIKNKTVLVLDYVHANASLYTTFNAGWILRSRDDLLLALSQIAHDPQTKPYDRQNVQKMLDHVVFANQSESIIDRYLTFIGVTHD